MVYSAPGRNHTLAHRTRPLDSTTHAPSVREQEGLWPLDYRRARSLRAPEPDVVVPIRGRVPVAVGRAHVERVIVPLAAAQDGLLSGRRPLWIPCRTAPIVVRIKPVTHSATLPAMSHASSGLFP